CFFARRRRHTRFSRDWSSDVCSSDLGPRTARGVAMKPKSWRESYTELKEIVVPPHCNHHGTVFGGHILALIDQVAGVTAMEHCGSSSVVTLMMDRVHFFRPVKEGQLLHLQARVVHTGQSSLEVYVKVYGKDLSGPQPKAWLTCEAYTIFVLVDAEGRPVKAVPPLLLETPEDHALFQAAAARREARLEEARRLRSTT